MNENFKLIGFYYFEVFIMPAPVLYSLDQVSGSAPRPAKVRVGVGLDTSFMAYSENRINSTSDVFT